MMRKCCVFFTLLLLFSYAGDCQVVNPVKWKYEVKKAGAGLYDIYFTAQISAPWHIYSQFLADGGPIPTQIFFDKNPLLSPVGKAKESGKAIKEHEAVFDMDVVYYPNKVSFIQRVKKSVKVKTNLTGKITYMICKEGECLPVVKQNFNVILD